MSKIKIISDPYRRRTDFLVWDDGWIPIDEAGNQSSNLLKKQFTEGVFPFKAREIIDILLDEYSDEEEELQIVFEGPDDEWAELQDVCSYSPDNLQDKIVLERSNRFLSNARDVLPFIRDTFEGVSPIIAGQVAGSPDAQEKLKKFREASSDVIPICVVGNYSAGKSSFINALIGIELLPSGDRPVTARVFQIERSAQPDQAFIKFEYANEPIQITFSRGWTQVSPLNMGGKLFEEIRAKESDKSVDMCERVRKVLAVINSYRGKPDEPYLSDLIEVCVPFGEATGWDSGKRIVIFDTPGSNSNTNVDHTRVLQEAMRGMSDGLPIYVTIYDSLDSNDNADLYNEISQIPALDERFAMIVVNKADDADLPENGFAGHEDWVMDTVIARNLYAQGIFFVSSIAGLGAKTDGIFSERHYDKVFRRLRDSFEDPEDKYYVRLFDYDLLPEQIRVKFVHASENCPNIILANSGLFGIEQGIIEFASKYSAYNKSLQSGSLFHDLVEYADARLESKAKLSENIYRLYKDELDKSRQSVLDSLLKLSLKASDDAITGYLPKMNEWAKLSLDSSTITSQALNNWESEITTRKQYEMGAEEKQKDAERKQAAITANLRSRVQNAWDTKDILGVTAIAKSLVSDIHAAREAGAESVETYHFADREASDDLLRLVQAQFDSAVTKLIEEAEGYSKTYWEGQSEAIRKELLECVTSGSEVGELQREKLQRIIIDYKSLTFKSNNSKIRKVRYPFDQNKLWKAPLVLLYNAELAQRVTIWRAIVEPAHEEQFQNWLHALMGEIINNIEDMNPDLREKVEAVTSTEYEIELLKTMRERLHTAEVRVSRLMMWQEA